MKLKNLALIAIAVSVFASCKDKKDDEEFTKLSVEENKEQIVESGLAVVEDLNGLSQLEGVSALQDLLTLIDNDGTFAAKSYVRCVRPLVAFSQNKGTLVLKSAMADSLVFSEDYDDVKGVYTYNKSTGEFVKASGNGIVFKFPIGSSTTNNAELSFTGFTYITKKYTDFEGAVVEQPTAFNIALKQGTTELMSFAFAASYDSNGFPTSITETFIVEKYKIVAEVKRNASEVSVGETFTYDGKNILSSEFSTKGNFTYDEIQAQDDVENASDQTVFSSANAYVAFGNFKVEGSISWSGLRDAVAKMDVEDKTDAQEEAALKDMAEALNGNAKLYFKYFDSGDIIAKSEFYYFEEEDWDYIEKNVGMRMTFKDGSEMDDSFFKNGFGELITSADDLMTDMKNSYGN